jgi:hypothetical protein
MIRDKVMTGGLVGLLGKIAMDIFQVLMWRLKLIKHPLAHYGASLIVNVQTVHHTLLGSVVSLLVDYIYGIFLGIVFVYFIYFTGKRHFIFKGLIFGAFVWLFSFGGLRSLPMVKLREVVSSEALYYLLFHLIFGLGLGFAMKRFSEHQWIE